VKKIFSNLEIVTLAVYLLGGDCRRVDSEDIAMKANELAPGRFAWRKYPEQINIHTIYSLLWYAKKRTQYGYVIGSEREGWQLTEKGFAFVKEHLSLLEGVDLTRERLSQKDKQWHSHERGRMLTEEAFLKFESGGASAVALREAEAFFKLDEYVVGNARERKIQRVVNAFADDPELGQAVRELASKARYR
jgi:hypothetical protein